MKYSSGINEIAWNICAMFFYRLVGRFVIRERGSHARIIQSNVVKNCLQDRRSSYCQARYYYAKVITLDELQCVTCKISSIILYIEPWIRFSARVSDKRIRLDRLKGCLRVQVNRDCLASENERKITVLLRFSSQVSRRVFARIVVRFLDSSRDWGNLDDRHLWKETRQERMRNE